jgi:Zn-dependent metalloprotease
MELASGGSVRTADSPVTGLVTFSASDPNRPIPTGATGSASREEKARAFLSTYGQAFGVTDVSRLRVMRTRKLDEVGMAHVRFQQTQNGVPVTGGELTVHLRGNSVAAVNAKVLPETEDVNTVPQVAPAAARSAARTLLAKHLQITDAVLSTPRLEIFNRGHLEGRPTPTRLAWFIEATKIDLREFIWVDAHTGDILLYFSQLPDARDRRIHDANDTPSLPGTLVRSEGGAATGDPEADRAYDFSGDTYDYYFTQHGRDSFDNAGATIRSTVHFCPSLFSCPYANAFWNGSQMVYGEGFAAADDVDAHELTHAVTQYSANLFYYMQSGALNESFSDIFGETVDLTNGKGTDTGAVRWRIGEDIPGVGAFRNMMDPTAFNDPGKMSDFEFVCASNNPPGDGGGVHSNSGVPNHAYALMVDGGAYNGFTLSGIGLTKAGKVQYRALTHYLLSASDFLDNYNALKQSCTDLVGTAGITAADCTQVTKALDAVEMASPWPCDPTQPTPPALCPAGQTPTMLFFDDLENTSSGNWIIQNIRANSNLWQYPPGPDAEFATSGVRNFWGDDAARVGDAAMRMTFNVGIPAGDVRMQFNHAYGFESSASTHYDGGVVEYSTNNGTSWSDAGALMTAGALYGGTLSLFDENPLAGRSAFVDDSYGYTATQLNLSSLAGQNVRFRFRLGTDPAVEDYGWFIDDIRMYQCSGGDETNTLTVTKEGAGSGTVTSTPAGIDCGATCAHDYVAGTDVTLVTVPMLGSVFVGWSGDPDCAEGIVTMNADKTCTATFDLAPTASLSVLAPNGGEVWLKNSLQTLLWSSTGISGRVRIEVSRDGGASWKILVRNTLNDGQHKWRVRGLATTQARIRVSSALSPAVFDVSDGNFAVQ